MAAYSGDAFLSNHHVRNSSPRYLNSSISSTTSSTTGEVGSLSASHLSSSSLSSKSSHDSWGSSSSFFFTGTFSLFSSSCSSAASAASSSAAAACSNTLLTTSAMILSDRRCFSTALNDASASFSALILSSFAVHHCLNGGGNTRYKGKSGARAYNAMHAARSCGAFDGPPLHARDFAQGRSIGSSASAMRLTVGAVPGGGLLPLFARAVFRWTRSRDRAHTRHRTVVLDATS
mmetsp:Transcript_645/g.1579  ORF Transcript_645/g.1579 Transcript_645/m.1579 type:complete len:233 (+) Transcript_645:1858-2556(+)